MIKQVILDMHNQLLQVKTQVAIAIADQHLLEKKKLENDDKDQRMDAQSRTRRRQKAGRPGSRRAAPRRKLSRHERKLRPTTRRPESPGREPEIGACAISIRS